ncbi:transcription elongation factor Elf1 like-domain-containing protein [Spinellus fusiger]|nr:transcription elongation factor Elf1 like-domain-containing protein [Spinellus fusiger]
MGKRKAKRKVAKKLKDKLDVQFNCLFCNHEKSVDVKLDHTNKVGHLSCKICDITWQCPINVLDEPVDVYSAWIDACEDVNKSKRNVRVSDRSRESAEESARPSTAAYSNDQLDPFDEDEEDDY